MRKKSTPPFVRQEWAVLKTRDGGRLFRVADCIEHEVAADHWKVIEYSDWGERHKRPPHEVNSDELIKVKDKDDALRLMGALQIIHIIGVREQHSLVQRTAERYKSAIAEFELYIFEDDE